MTEFFPHPILAIESSCDEMSAAVVIGRKILPNVVDSQVSLHQKWGGVVPEMAARAHVESVIPVIDEAIQASKIDSKELKGIAVTNRPGLIGSLSVGVIAAKSLSLSLNIPLIGIHHLEGHILSTLAEEENEPDFDIFPHLCLVASGGHTELVEVIEPGKYNLVGQTLDDAAGEALDKSARLLGFGYSGGKAIQESAANGDPHSYQLPIGIKKDPHNFSFSGLKTAVLRIVEKEGKNVHIPNLCASLQETVAKTLTEKTMKTAEKLGSKAVTLVGGVAANIRLRELLKENCEQRNLTFKTPRFKLCTDNAGMIGIAGSIRFAKNQTHDLDLDVYANADLPK